MRHTECTVASCIRSKLDEEGKLIKYCRLRFPRNFGCTYVDVTFDEDGQVTLDIHYKTNDIWMDSHN